MCRFDVEHYANETNTHTSHTTGLAWHWCLDCICADKCLPGAISPSMRTNRPVQGLVSIDRSKVAALVSTTPRPRPKSSTNDLALYLESVDSRFTTKGTGRWYAAEPKESSCPWLRDHVGRRTAVGPTISLPPDGRRAPRYRRMFGRDSDLEAFSHNPPDGSLAPLPYQAST